MRLLNIGAGPRGIPIPPHYHDWEVVRLDLEAEHEPDLLMDAMDLDTLEPGQFDAAYASHLLEHIAVPDLLGFLAGVRHVLAADGYAEFRVPNVLTACRRVAETGRLDVFCYQSTAGPVTAWDMLYCYLPYQIRYGAAMIHRNGFSPESLQVTLQTMGFPRVYTAASEWEIAAIACLTDLSAEMKRRLWIDEHSTVHPDDGGTDLGAVRLIRPVAELPLRDAPGDLGNGHTPAAPAAGGRGAFLPCATGLGRRL